MTIVGRTIEVDGELAGVLINGRADRIFTQVRRAQPVIEEFCKRGDVRLTGLGLSTDRGKPKVFYVFSSEDGGYFFNAIRESL
jgi:hypothetical protein